MPSGQEQLAAQADLEHRLAVVKAKEAWTNAKKRLVAMIPPEADSIPDLSRNVTI